MRGLLLTCDHIIAKQAAHYLLSYEGSSEANQVKQTLPKDLFPPNPFWEHYKQNPCTSGFAWRRENCEECLQRTDLTAYYIASHLKPFCSDPDLHVPADFGQRLQPLAHTIPVEVVWSRLSMTKEDHELEDIGPVMCAFCPGGFANLVR